MHTVVYYQKLKRFARLSPAEKWLFLEALFFTVAAKLLLLVVPFRYWIRLFANKSIGNSTPDLQQLKHIKKAIHRTRWLAFWKNQCIVMSVASRWMLQRRRISSSFSLGVAFNENRQLKAHAWLTTNELALVEKGGNFLELYHF